MRPPASVRIPAGSRPLPATQSAAGVEVTIVEALGLPLAHVLGAEVGRWIVATHRDEGVRVMTETTLEAAHGNGRVEELSLTGGRDFHVLYQRAGRPVAALTVDRPRELAALRRLIESDEPTDAETTDTHRSPTEEATS